MEVVKSFQVFYNVFDRMKDNDEQSPHIFSRLEALQELVGFVQNKEPDQLFDDVHKALDKLAIILESAKGMLERFNKTHMVKHMVKSSDYKAEFEKLNKSLTDAFVTLSGALHMHQEWTLDRQEVKLDEQRKKLAKQENVLAEQDNKLHEQEKRLAKQERKVVEQEDKLAEQEDLLQRLESKVMNQSKGFYCVLL